MSPPEMIAFPNAAALACAVAEAWLEEIARARQEGHTCCVALSGGRIAGTLFTEFCRQTQARKAALDHVHFFWADERCVPPGDAESNYRLAEELLFAALNISADRIHRIRGELDSEMAAREADAELRRIVPAATNGQPVLDLVLLGMGEDGHVASLFPGEPAVVASSAAIYRAVMAPKAPPRRVTLGYGVLAAAREVWVLVSGSGKEGALRESLRAEGRTPLARLLRSRTRTRVFGDFQCQS